MHDSHLKKRVKLGLTSSALVGKPPLLGLKLKTKPFFAISSLVDFELQALSRPGTVKETIICSSTTSPIVKGDQNGSDL
jgi:hypothetical protein